MGCFCFLFRFCFCFSCTPVKATIFPFDLNIIYSKINQRSSYMHFSCTYLIFHILCSTIHAVETSNNISEPVQKVVSQELERLLEGKSIVQFNSDFIKAHPNSLQYRLSGKAC